MKINNKVFLAIGLSLAVTGLLFFLLITQLAIKISGDSALEPILALTISSAKQDVYTLSYDPNGNEVNWIVADTAAKPPSEKSSEQVMRFALPEKKITRLKLDFGSQPDAILVRSIALITQAGNTCTWKGSELSRFFNQPSPDMGTLDIRSDSTQINSLGGSPYMVADPYVIENVCDQLSTMTTQQQVRWWAAGALVFGLLALAFFRFLQRGMPAAELVLLSGFFLLIALPLITQVSGVGKTIVSAENRALSSIPGVPATLDDLKNYPARWSAYFSDHFSGRNEMIFWGNQLKVRALKTSPVAAVILGKDKWLYYAGDMAGMDYQGLVQLPKAELKHLDKYLAGVQKNLDDRGIKFLVVISPDKQSVYPEFMPSTMYKVGQPSRADQFLAYNAKHARIDVVDLRTVLTEQKNQAPMDIFYKTDTHWNKLGAFYAYQAIMGQLSPWFPELVPHAVSDYKVTSVPHLGNDLAKLTMMRGYFTDTEVTLIPNFASPVKMSPFTYPMATLGEAYVTEIDDPSLPRLMMYHDSYGPFFTPYLSEHFERAVYLRTFKIDWDLIDQEKPDVVILEFVERLIQVIAPAQ